MKKYIYLVYLSSEFQEGVWMCEEAWLTCKATFV